MVITLHPNAKTINKYHPDINDDDAAYIQKNGISVELEYIKRKSYASFIDGLKGACILNDIQDHLENLAFIILVKNEQIRERYDAYWSNYNDDLNTKEIAKFLLAYKQSDPNNYFQLVIKENIGTVKKPKTESAAIKDTVIAKWMCEKIYDAIESQDFPLGIFGEKIIRDLNDLDSSDNAAISLDKLKAAAASSPRIPIVQVKKLMVELCLHIQAYLINETRLTASPDTLLTDAQANFLFDVLQAIGYESEDKIESPKKDYMHAMFSNNKAFIARYNGK